ncbi:MAG: DNA polymerase III subunit delta, partial [Sandarakinorhabdus sp.]|nr:DNA polymerase III subunit delta [Sandarakinorhabdus sp.]
MTALNRDPFLRALNSWKPETRLVLLFGPDESGSRDLASAAARALTDPADRMAITDLTPEELKSDPGRLADEAASVSMFGGRRLIRVAGAGESTADAARLLLEAAAAGNPVIMLAGDLSRANALRKLAEASPIAWAIISRPLEAREAAAWLQAKARELGLKLEPGVGERLLALTDGDTGILASELEKFALFLSAGTDAPRRLEREHLSVLGADSAEEDLMLLVGAVISGNQKMIERQLQLLHGSSAIPALRAVGRRLVQLAEARAAVDAGTQPAAAIKALRPPVFWKEAG